MALGAVTGKNKKQKEEIHIEPHALISSTEVEQIRKALIETHADLVVQGMLDKDVREQLEKVVARDFNQATKGNKEVIAYVVRETIGTGVIEEILQDPAITDVGYNGTELIIETNDSKVKFDTNFQVDEAYIVRLVNKFANANNKEFTSKNPIFDGRFDNVRINAVHAQNTAPESGTTMALRVVRPRLALTKDNFEGFAPMFMLDFFKAAALSKSNMVISGITGTGKTELHKLISGFIPFDHRILLIEDTPETFMKEMFKDKDVYSWVTSEDVDVTQLIKAGLRNHPTWIMVTETRGAEAYEMIQAVLSGHSIITSVHAVNARAIPARFVNMAKMGYQLDELALLDDIRRYFHFGIHIKKVKYHGHVIRYLNEIIWFDPEGDKTIFKQRFVDGVFYFETGDLPKEFMDEMEEAMVVLDFPENFKSERLFDPSKASGFKATIPLDKTGRPDYKKIKAMGTTIDILMGREKAPYDPSEDGDPIDYNVTKDGYIAPEIVSVTSDISSQKVRQVKQQVKQRVKSRPAPPNRPNNKKEPIDNSDIEADLKRILNKVEISNPKPPRPEPKAKPEPQQERTLSAQEILEQKRKQINKLNL